MLRMKASALMRKLRTSSSCSQDAARMSRSKRTWSVWVGVKAVKSCVAGEGRGAGVECLAVDPVRPPERLAPLEGAGGGAGEQAVAVAAGLGVAAGVEAVGGDRGGGDGYVVGAEAVEAARQVLRGLGGGVEACHLAEGVDAGVGAPGDGQPTGSRSTVARAVSSSPARSAARAGAPSRGSRRRRIRCPGEPWARRQYLRRAGRSRPAPRIGSMRILLTNDDGISAPGLQAAAAGAGRARRASRST